MQAQPSIGGTARCDVVRRPAGNGFADEVTFDEETRTHIVSNPALAALVEETMRHLLARFGHDAEVGVGLYHDPEDGHVSVEVVVVDPPGDATTIRHELQRWVAERIGQAPGAMSVDVLSSAA